VDYEPGESLIGIFGGNSNWRGPIWFPVNFLLVESLQKFHRYLGNDFKVEFPTGSGNTKTLWDGAGELSRRMTDIFLRDEKGHRPVFGNLEKFQTDPHWRDSISLSRILPRRLRFRHGRQPSNRMDRCCRQVNATERRIPRT
jgi:hypothetical protein